MKKGVFKPILQKRNRLSESDLNIFNYINSFPDDSFNLNLTELAAACFVSEASVSRFVRKNLFNSYREMVLYINKQIQSINSQSCLLINQDEEFNKLYNIQNYAFQATINDRNLQKIKTAANMIYQANRVAVLGLGSSYKTASEFAANLRKIGLNVISDPDFHVFFPLIALLDKKSLLIVVSNKMINREIIIAIETAKSQQCKIVVITSNEENILNNCIDLKISYHKIHDKNKHVPSASKISQFLIIDYLFDHLLNKNPKFKKNLDKTQNILKKWI
ncbi:RpiR family carbohydrate utilization transcriptional regulator [Mycoplasmoides fastidiosum]|uniref:RpiR family carbohydrate utilization transcriptional regulator n=1 Tax=Mycoplasmoides fastidiosum TaxID=92758 RepID=A0ABU0LZ56_9BACT|nr:MurR/RpiR family transcriptional regulator [Mycoplasmoides fastidiosum]MDQ0513963.1 RpiR family carbohydrate utilization transcriptional regulator [Mycoplasmoides fastidiosum]UUD37623.1 MurR/RpiR family transcriptional regulator [Mycoplasmoides fastidiosum]